MSAIELGMLIGTTGYFIADTIGKRINYPSWATWLMFTSGSIAGDILYVHF